MSSGTSSGKASLGRLGHMAAKTFWGAPPDSEGHLWGTVISGTLLGSAEGAPWGRVWTSDRTQSSSTHPALPPAPYGRGRSLYPYILRCFFSIQAAGEGELTVQCLAHWRGQLGPLQLFLMCRQLSEAWTTATQGAQRQDTLDLPGKDGEIGKVWFWQSLGV